MDTKIGWHQREIELRMEAISINSLLRPLYLLQEIFEVKSSMSLTMDLQCDFIQYHASVYVSINRF